MTNETGSSIIQRPNDKADLEEEEKLFLGAKDFQLNWAKQDIEQKCGFRGGRFTSVNKAFTFVIALGLTVAYFVCLVFFVRPHESLRWLSNMFLERGWVPYPTMLLFFWALAILFVKAKKLQFQWEALELAAVPQQPDFVLNPESARAVLTRLHALVDDTGSFLLLNRIERALSNLQNIGNATDVATILRNQADYDSERAAASYGLVNSVIWAIPVLGFIGTVLGLRQAIAALGLTLHAGNDLSSLRDSLQLVTAGLATKFETTLVALVCAVIIQLLVAFVQSRETEFLDGCNDYCHANVAAKLKLR
jgi:biopolymer transport protein ExbB/TolQ